MLPRNLMKSRTCWSFRTPTRFACRAYRNAARKINDLSESLATIAADPTRELTAIDGIGKDLALKISEVLETGSIAMLEELRGDTRGRAGDGSHPGPWAEKGGRSL